MEHSMFRSAYQGQREYFIEFYLRGITETFVYPVTQENHERLRAVLPEEEMESVPPEFWGFETTDNKTVVISVHDIQLARLLWEPGQNDEHKRNDTDEVTIQHQGLSMILCKWIFRFFIKQAFCLQT
jgi:hypothetical protein